MSVLSDFFVAEGPLPPAYDCGEGVAAEDRAQFRRLTPLQAAEMLAVLRGVEYRVELIDEFRLLTPEDADEWIMSVPDDMVQALSILDPTQVASVATEFAKATAEELGWSSTDFEPVVTELTRLAQRAKASNRHMYLWNSL